MQTSAPRRLTDLRHDQVRAAPTSSSIADAVREGVLLLGEGGRIEWCNLAARRLLRVAADDLMQRSVVDVEWNMLRPDGRAFSADEHPAIRALASGERQADVVVGLTIGDRSRRWFSVGVSPTDHERDNVVIMVFSDVTAEFDSAGELRSVMDEIQVTSQQHEWPIDDRVSFAARYRSVGPSRRIGGDFYGAYEVGERRTGFFLGDVCGHGVKAAGLSALARNTFQAIGPLLTDANEVLARLHDVVGRQRPDSYLTAIYGYIEDDTHGTKIRFACGGHPPPILISDGVASYIGGPGLIIGMIPNLERTVHETRVRPGDQIVLYSDGLLSTPTPQLEEPELLSVVPTDLSAEDLVDTLLEIASPAVHDVGYDDTAIMVMHFN